LGKGGDAKGLMDNLAYWPALFWQHEQSDLTARDMALGKDRASLLIWHLFTE